MYDLPPAPVLEVYFAPACAPCQLELPLLAELSRDPSFNFVIVILNEKDRAIASIAKVAPDLLKHTVDAAGQDERTALRLAGNSDGILPYARTVSASKTLCQSWRGRLSPEVIRRMLDRCRGL